jgi:hypothetical protein
MKKNSIKGLFAIAFVATVMIFSGCKSKDPSILKVFVRSENNELVASAKVVIIGDVNSNPPTMPYVDTVVTNQSGFAEFNMDDYFNSSGEETTGYFDIIVKKDTKTGEGRIRCRQHITAVETVFFPQ